MAPTARRMARSSLPYRLQPQPASARAVRQFIAARPPGTATGVATGYATYHALERVLQQTPGRDIGTPDMLCTLVRHPDERVLDLVGQVAHTTDAARAIAALADRAVSDAAGAGLHWTYAHTVLAALPERLRRDMLGDRGEEFIQPMRAWLEAGPRRRALLPLIRSTTPVPLQRLVASHAATLTAPMVRRLLHRNYTFAEALGTNRRLTPAARHALLTWAVTRIRTAGRRYRRSAMNAGLVAEYARNALIAAMPRQGLPTALSGALAALLPCEDSLIVEFVATALIADPRSSADRLHAIYTRLLSLLPAIYRDPHADPVVLSLVRHPRCPRSVWRGLVEGTDAVPALVAVAQRPRARRDPVIRARLLASHSIQVLTLLLPTCTAAEHHAITHALVARSARTQAALRRLVVEHGLAVPPDLTHDEIQRLLTHRDLAVRLFGLDLVSGLPDVPTDAGVAGSSDAPAPLLS